VGKPLLAFDWKNPAPCYEVIWQQRAERLRQIRSTPEPQRSEYLAGLFDYYRENPWDFIQDWGVTADPRKVDLGEDPMMPFVLFPKQVEFCKYVFRKWKERKPGLADKSRDGGLSWLAVAMGCTLCLFHPGMNVGYGSVTEDYVDKIGEPKSLFWKARVFMTELPREFKGPWDINRHAPHMRILFPNGSTMTGQSGDNIGRGDRKGIYFIDESSHLANPKAVDFALSQTTNCRIDISTPKGLGNSFAHRRNSGKIEVFTLHWRDDPRKDEAWYKKQIEDIDDPVVVAQEIDINYAASVEGVVIPNNWLLACVDAAKKLGVQPTGERSGALDIADEGRDKNAFVAAYGIELIDLIEWTGVDSDIFDTVEKAFSLSDKHGIDRFKYDGDGLGAGARGDARILNTARKAASQKEIEVVAFRGSAGVFNPEGEDVKGRKNKDYFANRKAQGWWALRTRVRNTFRLVTEGKICSHDDIISIPSTLPNFMKLIGELSSPTFATNPIGKIVIDKQPAGAKSPNLGDVVMMKFAQVERAPMHITDNVLKAVAQLGRGRRRR
jgi:phage terminase large subunit